MRDLILAAALLSILPLMLRAPVVGLLTWIWVALMYPQREVYGFLSTFQVNLLVAVLTIVAWAASKERKVVPLNPTTGVMVAFGLWACFTTYVGLDPAFSATSLDRLLKGMLLAILATVLLNTKVRIQAAVWAIAISLGYYGVKGGGFTLLTAGRHRVFGPDDTQIGDNNLLGLALVMALPLLNYLRVSSRDKLVSYGCLAVMGLTLLAIIGTYSRGALLALAALGLVYMVRSRGGLIPLVLGIILVAALPRVMPADWFARMATIQSAEQDASFGNRLQAWTTSWNIAKAHPITGAGFAAIEQDSVAKTYSSPGSLDRGRAAHSIYMQVLSDHGFVGLGIYLLLIATAWFNTMSTIAFTRGKPELEWAATLTRMLQLSFVGFLVGGAGLSMAYYDGFLLLLALSVAVSSAVRQPQAKGKTPSPSTALAVQQQSAPR